MKLKEYRNSNVFKVADVVKYYDEDGNELELPSTEVQRRKFYNKEIVDHGTMIDTGIATLEVYLK